MPEPAQQSAAEAPSTIEGRVVGKGGEVVTLSAPPLPAPSTCVNAQLAVPGELTRPMVSPFAQLPVLFGDYEILEEVARGGMGIVYKARHVRLDRLVALKMILTSGLPPEGTVQRFYREARAAAALDHPHIVPIHDVGEREGQHFYTMAYVEGTSLKGMVHQYGPATTEQAVSILLGVVEAVAFAHAHGIIHRDLKPENILIDHHGRARVTDFGLAKHPLSDPNLTGSGQPLGTPSYMPPEQARGQLDRIGPSSDVFSLGGILYFLLTGSAPFRGENFTEILQKVLFEEPIPPQQLNPQASQELAAICLKCLEKDPARRYPSASALAEALRCVAAGIGPLPTRDPDRKESPAGCVAPKEGAASSPGAAVGSRGSAWLLWGGLAIALLGLVVGLLSFWGPSAPDVDERIWQVIPSPEEMRKDFGLEVTWLGGRAGTDGVRELEAGEPVRFRVKVARPSYVGIWTVDAKGYVVQLFPYKGERHLLRAGEERDVPADVLRAVPSRRPELIWVEASTKYWEPLAGELHGPFELFRADRDRLAWVHQREQLRTLVHDDEVALAEAVLRYRVHSGR